MFCNSNAEYDNNGGERSEPTHGGHRFWQFKKRRVGCKWKNNKQEGSSLKSIHSLDEVSLASHGVLTQLLTFYVE